MTHESHSSSQLPGSSSSAVFARTALESSARLRKMSARLCASASIVSDSIAMSSTTSRISSSDGSAVALFREFEKA